MKHEQFVCDVCGTCKRKQERWWVVKLATVVARIERWDTQDRKENEFDCCSIQCALEKVIEWMERVGA